VFVGRPKAKFAHCNPTTGL